MPKLDMTRTTIEVPRYLKSDLRALAVADTPAGHTTKSMKTYLIELVAREKQKVNLT